MPTVSGSEHPPHGNWGASQAVCTPIIKSPTVSGSGHFLCSPFTKSAGRLRLLHRHDENCRQSQALSALPHENWGTSQALCTPHDEHCRPSQALSTPPHGNWGDVSGCLHPHHKLADSLRLLGTFCALHSLKLGDVSGSLHPHDENCRQLQALSTPPHGNWGDVSGFLHPRHKIADSLRLWALSVLSIHQSAGRLRLVAPP